MRMRQCVRGRSRRVGEARRPSRDRKWLIPHFHSPSRQTQLSRFISHGLLPNPQLESFSNPCVNALGSELTPPLQPTESRDAFSRGVSVVLRY